MASYIHVHPLAKFRGYRMVLSFLLSDESKYALKDRQAEAAMNCDLAESMRRSRKLPLFKVRQQSTKIANRDNSKQ